MNFFHQYLVVFFRLSCEAVENKMLIRILQSIDSFRVFIHETFRDGFSTKATANEISGRGVGMSAFAHAVLLAGRSLKVRTQSGEGTEFDIEIPKRKWESGQIHLLRLHPPQLLSNRNMW